MFDRPLEHRASVTLANDRSRKSGQPLGASEEIREGNLSYTVRQGDDDFLPQVQTVGMLRLVSLDAVGDVQGLSVEREQVTCDLPPPVIPLVMLFRGHS